MRRATPRLPIRHAAILGLLHGPTELLPVSSSGHTTLVPWLAGWPYDELDPRLRKSFEVALHAGTATALIVRPPCRGGGERRPWARGTREVSPRRIGARLGFLAAAVIPPALTGYTLGERIERQLGTPATIAAGLLGGSAAMIAGELRTRGECRWWRLDDTPSTDGGAAVSFPPHQRCAASAGPLDGLALGIAQAIALIPGVSRSGASLAVARALGFSRAEADRLSWTVGLPVIAGATLLKGSRLVREGAPRGLRAPLAAGAAGAFLSTLASATALGPERRGALLPMCAVYRAALALVVVRRMRDNTSRRAPSIPKK